MSFNVSDNNAGSVGSAWKSLPYRATGSGNRTLKMANAGLGVVSKTFIPKYAWLAEYEGFTVLPHEEDHISAYAWGVSIANKIEKCTKIKLNKNAFQ